MRPFLGLSIPEVPSYAEFAALASLPLADVPATSKSATKPQSASDKPTTEALALLDSAAEALKNARKEWEAISKASSTIARTKNCDDWWRADVKNVLRACIAANIAVGTAKKAVAGAGKSKRVTDVLRVVVGAGDGDKGKGSYHAFWIVPKVMAL